MWATSSNVPWEKAKPLKCRISGEYRAGGASGESLLRVASLRRKAQGRLDVLMEQNMDVPKGKDVIKVGLAQEHTYSCTFTYSWAIWTLF